MVPHCDLRNNICEEPYDTVSYGIGTIPVLPVVNFLQCHCLNDIVIFKSNCKLGAISLKKGLNPFHLVKADS